MRKIALKFTLIREDTPSVLGRFFLKILKMGKILIYQAKGMRGCLDEAHS